MAHRRWALLVICAAGLLAAGAPFPAARASSLVQSLAIPAYFSPGPLWTQMEQGVPAVGIAIMNPYNGPGASRDPAYVAQVRHSQAAGLTVVGYVYTSYTRRPLAAVEQDIRNYHTWYGVDGIFVDNASTSCADEPYYAALFSFIKAQGGHALVMLNPGTWTSECYMAAGDIVVTFESGYKSYLNGFYAPPWVARYPASRFEHIVYNVPTVAALRLTIALSKQRAAGWLYVTNDVLPNPYDTLPGGPYWQAELALAHR